MAKPISTIARLTLLAALLAAGSLASVSALADPAPAPISNGGIGSGGHRPGGVSDGGRRAGGGSDGGLDQGGGSTAGGGGMSDGTVSGGGIYRGGGIDGGG